MKKSLRMRLSALVAGLALAALLGEGAWRLLRNAATGPRMFFEDEARVAFDPANSSQQRAIEFLSRIGTLLPLPADAPMPRPQGSIWLPGAVFHICYSGPRQPYFDERGCVEMRFNSFGIRDRADLTLEKPAGTSRIVCLGDSFTLGWGVRRERGWPVLVEDELRAQQMPVQVVNCGGAGSSYADEYLFALRDRFGRFAPDLVLVTLCLNDLLVTNDKLCHYRLAALDEAHLPPEEHRWWMASQVLFDLRRTLASSSALALDPDRDWVQELLDLPRDHVWYRIKSECPELFWGQGTPQRALLGIRDWCRDHGARVAVVVWPFLQGLGDGERYPFAKLHRLVGAWCAAEGVPFLDLQPVLQGNRVEDLWVSPADMHPNERAHALVAPAVAAFAADAMEVR